MNLLFFCFMIDRENWFQTFYFSFTGKVHWSIWHLTPHQLGVVGFMGWHLQSHDRLLFTSLLSYPLNHLSPFTVNIPTWSNNYYAFLLQKLLTPYMMDMENCLLILLPVGSPAFMRTSYIAWHLLFTLGNHECKSFQDMGGWSLTKALDLTCAILFS